MDERMTLYHPNTYDWVLKAFQEAFPGARVSLDYFVGEPRDCMLTISFADLDGRYWQWWLRHTRPTGEIRGLPVDADPQRTVDAFIASLRLTVSALRDNHDSH